VLLKGPAGPRRARVEFVTDGDLGGYARGFDYDAAATQEARRLAPQERIRTGHFTACGLVLARRPETARAEARSCQLPI
jgi:hypothetical protein